MKGSTSQRRKANQGVRLGTPGLPYVMTVGRSGLRQRAHALPFAHAMPHANINEADSHSRNANFTMCTSTTRRLLRPFIHGFRIG